MDGQGLKVGDGHHGSVGSSCRSADPSRTASSDSKAPLRTPPFAAFARHAVPSTGFTRAMGTPYIVATIAVCRFMLRAVSSPGERASVPLGALGVGSRSLLAWSPSGQNRVGVVQLSSHVGSAGVAAAEWGARHVTRCHSGDEGQAPPAVLVGKRRRNEVVRPIQQPLRKCHPFILDGVICGEL